MEVILYQVAREEIKARAAIANEVRAGLARVNECERKYAHARLGHDENVKYEASKELVAMRDWWASQQEIFNADLKKWDDIECGCNSACDDKYYQDANRTKRERLNGLCEEHKLWLSTGTLPPWLSDAVVSERKMLRGDENNTIKGKSSTSKEIVADRISRDAPSTSVRSATITATPKQKLFAGAINVVPETSSVDWVDAFIAIAGSRHDSLRLLGLSTPTELESLRYSGMALFTSNLSMLPLKLISTLGAAGCNVVLCVNSCEYVDNLSALTWLPNGHPCWSVLWGATPDDTCHSLTLTIPHEFHLAYTNSGASVTWGLDGGTRCDFALQIEEVHGDATSETYTHLFSRSGSWLGCSDDATPVAAFTSDIVVHSVHS